MLKPGDTFERYTIEAAIGEGGMGTVYRARDSKLERSVALKVISDEAQSPEASERMLREARAVAALDHPNAVSIFDVGVAVGTPYIVMELVTGRTLRPVVDDASVPAAARLGWLTDVARALAAAHRRGIVHRDVKPENIMVREDGVLKVLDFGIARRTAGQLDPHGTTALKPLTREGVTIGTPAYMAPEQIRGGELDGRADQFAWGVVAYELLSGRLPWQDTHDSLALVASILTDDVDVAPLAAAGVPTSVQAVILRALGRRPRERFTSMDDVATALDAAVKGDVPGPTVSAAPAAPAGHGTVPLAALDAVEVAPVSTPPTSGRAPREESTPPDPGRAHAVGATLAQRFSSQEVKQILSRAIEEQANRGADTRLGFDDLLAAAREVGVDPETLREASRELRERGQVSVVPAADDAEMKAWLRRKRRAFHRHLAIWLAVQVVFAVMALMKGNPRAMVPGLFWAIGLAIHGITAYTTTADDWEEIQRKKRRRAARNERRKQVVGKAIEEGAALLLQTGAALRLRLPAMNPNAEARVRVAPSDEVERGGRAEEEAATTDPERARDRRRSARRGR